MPQHTPNGEPFAVSSTSYLPDGKVASRTDPLGQTTTYAYWANGQSKSVTDPLGNFTTSEYDDSGRQTLVRDALNRANRFEYDGAGPFELEKIENTIDSVAKPIQWQTWKWAGPPAPDPFNSAEWPGPSYFMMDL